MWLGMGQLDNPHCASDKKGGGSSICEHGKNKQGCKLCGGSGICEHAKDKRYFKDCGG